MIPLTEEQMKIREWGNKWNFEQVHGNQSIQELIDSLDSNSLGEKKIKSDGGK